MTRRRRLVLGLAIAGLATACWALRRPAPREGEYAVDLALPRAGAPAPGPLQAGAAAVDITPATTAGTVYIGGYGFDRRATGVRDQIWARALVLGDGRSRVALVALDLVGLFYQHTVAVRRALPAELSLDYVVLASTHNHEGPDTLGLWGPTPLQTGRNDAYLRRVEQSCVEAITRAAANLQPVALRAAATRTGAEGYISDQRPPEVIDDELTVLAFDGPDGRAVATLVVWSNHPEAVGPTNTLITSDYPHALRARIEAERGGLALFCAGSVGGLMSPGGATVIDERGQKLRESGFDKADALGRNVAGLALSALAAPASVQDRPALALRARTLAIPLQNWRFDLSARLGIIDRGLLPTGPRTEIGVLAIGDAEFLLVPGEIYPEIVIGGIVRLPGADYDVEPQELPPLKTAMRGRLRAVIGLANDEIGYIIPKSEWDVDGPYGEINACGPDAAPTLHGAFIELLR